MIIIKTQIEISAPIQLCFDLARDIDVHTRTVWKHTNERAIAGVASGPIGPGETVTFEATMFEAPFGIIGRAFDKMILKRYMRSFIEHRNLELKKWAEGQ